MIPGLLLMMSVIWMITGLSLLMSAMTASSAFGSAKAMQAAEQQGTASAKTAGQQTAAPPSRPNPDASGVYHPANGVTPPQVIYSVDPEFTEKARKKKLGGTCTVGIVVDANGVPQDVHVVKSIAESVSPKLRSVAQGLDANAVEAVKQYRFKPATYQGKVVPTEVKIDVNFRIY
jgi:TonB family protein